jgi:chromosome segregation protein
MGPINPLALSEYEALGRAPRVLAEAARRSCATRVASSTRVIKAVDEEIVTVFDSAFADVAPHFSELFTMLFPGGSGRVVLTDPHDLLNTGIEMEARPSGKTCADCRCCRVASVRSPRSRICSPCSAPGRRPST